MAIVNNRQITGIRWAADQSLDNYESPMSPGYKDTRKHALICPTYATSVYEAGHGA